MADSCTEAASETLPVCVGHHQRVTRVGEMRLVADEETGTVHAGQSARGAVGMQHRGNGALPGHGPW